VKTLVKTGVANGASGGELGRESLKLTRRWRREGEGC